MAINKDKLVNGVNLPYLKIGTYSGNKQSLTVTVCHQASEEFSPLYTENVELSSEHSTELADKITALIYTELKSLGYLTGEDC